MSNSQPDPLIKKHEKEWWVCRQSYKPPSERQQRLEGGIFRKDLNTPETCIYKLDGKIIVGFRGTASRKDLHDDMKITMSQIYPRSLEAQSLVQLLLKDHPCYPVVLCGHSLGGAIARDVSSKLNLPAVTFNAASPPSAPVTTSSKETSYHIAFDIISAWQSPNVIRINKGHFPIPTAFEKLFILTWYQSSISELASAHKLSNFSNTEPGELITAEQEEKNINSWLYSCPPTMRNLFLSGVLGISGNYGVPPLS
jgi:pimeloyl-ACP methyl ester carboxylesterase